MVKGLKIMNTKKNKEQNFAEIIYKSLEAINYSSESDNDKLRAAVLDFSISYPDEGKFFFSAADDVFIRICNNVNFKKPEQMAAIIQYASNYLQNGIYRTSPKYSNYIANQVVKGFLIYSSRQTEIVDSEYSPDYFADDLEARSEIPQYDVQDSVAKALEETARIRTEEEKKIIAALERIRSGRFG